MVWFEYEAHIIKTKGWLMGGKGGVPPPKILGGFYGLTSHGFDQGERRKGTLYETKQKRRKKEMKETKKRGKKRNDIFFLFFTS